MKRAVFALLLTLVPTLVLAQVPDSFHYQGRLTDLAGVPVDTATTGAPVEMIFELFDSATATTAVWTQTFPAVDVDEGLFQVDLGGTAAPLTAVDFGQPLWLQITVDGDLLGARLPMLAVPQALHAADSSLLDGVTAASLEESAEIQSEIAAHAGDPDAHHSSVSAGLAITPASVSATGGVSGDTVTAAVDVSAGGDVVAAGALVGGNGLAVTGEGYVSGNLIVDGDVGIGVALPAYELDINGALRVQGNVVRRDDGTALLSGTADRTKLIADGGRFLSFYTGNSGTAGERARLDASGNLGLGMTSPAERLDVNGTSRLNGTVHLYGSSTAGYGDGYRIRSDGNHFATNADAIVFEKTDSNNATPDGGIVFANLGSGGTSVDAMAIRGTGNVGIGTSAPAQRLHVVGSQIRLDNSGNEATLSLNNTGAGGNTWLLRSTSNASGHGGGKLVFDIGGVDKATLLPSGRFGLGTTNPNRPLVVVGQSEDNLIRFRRSASENTYGELVSGTSGVAIAARNAADGYGLHFYASSGTSNTERMRITRGGRIGMGETSPDARLHLLNTSSADTLLIEDTAGDTSPFIISSGGRVGIGTTNNTGPAKKVHIRWDSGGGSALYVEDASTGTGTPEAIRANVNASGASNGQPVGVRGDSVHNSPAQGGYGVVGYNRARGQSSGFSGAGMWGGSVGNPSNPSQFNGQGHGVQGESFSTALGQSGLWGAALASSGRVYGVYGQTNSGGNQSAGVRGHVLANSGSNADGVRGSTLAGGSGSYGVYSSGDFAASGSKSALVYTDSQGPTELYAVEAAGVWFEDLGEARLQGGSVFVSIDPLLAETITIDDEHPMQVFVTPYADVDLWVERAEGGFWVHERGGGASDAAFAWRMVAKRRHYEDRRLRAAPEHIDRHMRPDLTEAERDALNRRWGQPTAAEANGGGESLTTARALGLTTPEDE